MAIWPNTELTTTTWPLPRATQSGSKALVSAIGAKKSTSMICRYAGSPVSRVAVRWEIPALLARRSMGPKKLAARFASAPASSSRDRSTGNTATSCGRGSDWRTRSNSLARRDDRTSLAPRAAARWARASPMPLEAPVIQTTLLLSSVIRAVGSWIGYALWERRKSRCRWLQRPIATSVAATDIAPQGKITNRSAR